MSETAAGAAAGTETVPPTRYLLGLAGAGAVAVFLVAGGLFFVLPRVGLATLPLRARLGQMITGFSERVELGSYGSILTDSNVVMRVHLPDEVQPDRYPNLRWRGVVLDTFDGQAWSIRYPRQIRLVRPSSGGFDVGLLRGSGLFLRQEIFLEPIASEVVFAAPRSPPPDRWRPRCWRWTTWAPCPVSSPGARLRYTVESEVEGPSVRGAPLRRPAPPLDAAQLQRYLQLPVLRAGDPGAGAAGRGRRASRRRRSRAAWRSSCGPSSATRSTLERVSQLDPLQEFLFVRRAGHCEYFAAAMAVMLRSLGVPSRVVNGFQRGEWNPYGQYYIVRYYDAHSWVEAFMPDVGLGDLRPDAAGDGGLASGQRPTLLYLDSLRLQWHRYVVNWTLRDQIRAVQSVQFRLAGFADWSAGLDAETRGRLRPRRLARARRGARGSSAAWAAWRHRRGGFGAGRSRTPGLLPARPSGRRAPRTPPGGRRDRAGVQRPSRRPRTGGGSAFTRVTALYERARFGGTPPDAADARGGGGLARRPRPQVALTVPPLSPARSSTIAFGRPRIRSLRYAGRQTTRSSSGRDHAARARPPSGTWRDRGPHEGWGWSPDRRARRLARRRRRPGGGPRRRGGLGGDPRRATRASRPAGRSRTGEAPSTTSRWSSRTASACSI